MKLPQDLKDNVIELHRRRIAKADVVSLSDLRSLKVKKTRCKILVVEDDPVMRTALQRILVSAGYGVEIAEDGLQLAHLLDDFSPDIIVLDIGLPWVDGIELCALIRGSQRLGKVPVVFLSGSVDDKDRQACFSAGASAFVGKPFEIQKLIATLETLTQPPMAHP